MSADVVVQSSAVLIGTQVISRLTEIENLGNPGYSKCQSLSDGIMRKNCCSFGFCPNYLSPRLVSSVTLFCRANDINKNERSRDFRKSWISKMSEFNTDMSLGQNKYGLTTATKSLS